MVYTKWSGQGFHLSDWLHLASIFPPFYQPQPNSLGFSLAEGERLQVPLLHWHPVLQPFVCCITYIWAECVLYVYYTCVHVCRKRVLVCFGFLSEIDGVEQLLFYLSLISLVWNFNSCHKSASGYGGVVHTMQAKSVWVCAFPDRCMCKCVILACSVIS